MVQLKKFTLPKLGVDVDEVRIVNWLIKEGDAFEAGDVLLEVETDKSIVEVPAPAKGVLVQLVAHVDETVEANGLLAKVEMEGVDTEEDQRLEPEPEQIETDESKSVSSNTESERVDQSTQELDGSQDFIMSSPAARHYARTNALDLEEVKGSGPNGRIVLADIKRELNKREASLQRPAMTSVEGQVGRAVLTSFGEIYLTTHKPLAARELPPVVLIHGMFSDSAGWSAVVHSLMKLGLTVYTFDLPGHGKSTAQVDSLAKMVEAVGEALEGELLQPAIMVGHSLGAAISVKLAKSQPSLCRSLVLLSPAGLGTEINEGFLQGMLNAKNESALRRELKKLSYEPMPLSTGGANALLTTLEQNKQILSSIVDDICFNGTQQIDVTQGLESISLPVKVLHGRNDQIIPWQHVLSLSGEISMHLPKNCGHMPHWEAVPLVSSNILNMALSS